MKMLENNSGREIGDPHYWNGIKEFEGVCLNAHRSIVRSFLDVTFIFPSSLRAKFVEIQSKNIQAEIEEWDMGNCPQGIYEGVDSMISAVWHQEEEYQEIFLKCFLKCFPWKNEYRDALKVLKYKKLEDSYAKTFNDLNNAFNNLIHWKL